MSVESVALNDEQLVQGTRRWSGYAFSLILCFFVIVISFVYGLLVGVNRTSQAAFAGTPDWDRLFFISHSRIELPSETTSTPLGEEIEINGKPGEIVNFNSDRPVKKIIEEQAKKWQARGDKVVAYATTHRGFAVGYSLERRERFSISAWFVPPGLRNNAISRSPVQGMISVVDMDGASAVEEKGEIYGIPLMPGGEGGAVFSAKEVGGRSYAGVYTNPAALSESLTFYTNELTRSGWKIVREPGGEANRWGNTEVGNLRFIRDKVELNMLFSALANKGSEIAPKTVVSINLSPFRGNL